MQLIAERKIAGDWCCFQEEFVCLHFVVFRETHVAQVEFEWQPKNICHRRLIDEKYLVIRSLSCIDYIQQFKQINVIASVLLQSQRV